MKKVIFLILTAVLLYPHTSSAPFLKVFNKYELIISLPKYTYKKFEPVLVNIQVINHDTKQLELIEGFLPVEKAWEVVISDQYGKSTSGNKFRGELQFAYTTPNYVIQPGDTLFASMDISNWGKEAIGTQNGRYDSAYFSSGYFEPGKYTAFITKDFNLTPRGLGDLVTSNEVEFEVIELNSEDKDFLRLLKQLAPLNRPGKKDILTKYPDNTFTEHLYIRYLSGLHSNVLFYERYEEENRLESDYQDFIRKYPNSSYLLIDRFVAPYIYKHFMEINNLKDNFENEIENFSSVNDNNNLKYFLKDERRAKLILRHE